MLFYWFILGPMVPLICRLRYRNVRMFWREILAEMKKSTFAQMVSVLTAVHAVSVPFRFDPTAAVFDIPLPLVAGVNAVAQTKEQLDRLINSLQVCHAENGYELRVDSSDASRVRLCCSTHTKTRKSTSTGQRARPTMRCTKCPVAVSFRFDEAIGMWYVSSITSTLHNHQPTRIRQPLRFIRDLILPSIRHQHNVHHVPMASLLSQQAENGFHLTRQELYNILAFTPPGMADAMSSETDASTTRFPKQLS